MLVQINAGDVQMSDAIRSHTEGQLQRALKYLSDRVTRVEVHLRDDNGPGKSGQNDKRCTMEARPAGQQPLAVDHQGEDLYEVITESANKLGKALKRHFEKLDQKR